MALVDQGRMEVDASFVTHMDRCLDCRACETACPSGVEYGKLIELARAQIHQKYRRPPLTRFLNDLVYRKLLPYPHRIALFARLGKMYQRSGAETLVRASGILRLIGLQERAQLFPRIDSDFFYSEVGKTFPAKGARRSRVAFFAGCVAQVTFSELNRATVRVLQANGCEVVIPAAQNCCGALAAHSGDRETARMLSKINLGVFPVADFDAIVTNAAGCGSSLKEYPSLFPTDGPEHKKSAAFSAKVRDVTEFLADLGLSAQLHPIRLRVTYQDSCHLLHGQKIREAPRKLIRAIPEIEFVEMPLSDQCCGSAGVYNVTQPRAAMDLLGQKMDCAQRTKAAAIVTANPGCILQLRAGVNLHDTGQEVLHVVELLDRSISR